MLPQDFCRRVYCAVVDAITMDPVSGQLSVRANTGIGSNRNSIHIEATGVISFEWEGTIKDPDGFFKLSTVEIRRLRDGWHVQFEPWYSSRLNFTCRTLSINRETVAGDGAWYQDGLEGPVPEKRPAAS